MRHGLRTDGDQAYVIGTWYGNKQVTQLTAAIKQHDIGGPGLDAFVHACHTSPDIAVGPFNEAIGVHHQYVAG
jgi:hypothetical protein